VFSSDSSDMQYASLAPLTTYVWVNAMGVNVVPIVFMHVRTGAKLRHLDAVLVSAIQRYGGEVHLVLPRAGDLSATTLQNIRLAAFQRAGFSPDDYVITSDADIWPLSREFWKNILESNKDEMFIYNGHFYNDQRRKGSSDFAALSFLGAPVRHWRRIYEGWCDKFGITAQSPGRLFSTVWQIIDAGIGTYQRWKWDEQKGRVGVQWSWDQIMVGLWLDSTDQCPGACHVNMHVNRLDRQNFEWNAGQESSDAEAIQRFTDAHLLFPLSDVNVYFELRRVWKALFNGSSEPLDSFRAEIMKAIEEDKKEGVT